MVEEEQKSHHIEKVKSHRNSGEAANQTHESRHGQLVMKKVQYYITVLYRTIRKILIFFVNLVFCKVAQKQISASIIFCKIFLMLIVMILSFLKS